MSERGRPPGWDRWTQLADAAGGIDVAPILRATGGQPDLQAEGRRVGLPVRELLRQMDNLTRAGLLAPHPSGRGHVRRAPRRRRPAP